MQVIDILPLLIFLLIAGIAIWAQSANYRYDFTQIIKKVIIGHPQLLG
jgi:hypothetical protein